MKINKTLRQATLLCCFFIKMASSHVYADDAISHPEWVIEMAQKIEENEKSLRRVRQQILEKETDKVSAQVNDEKEKMVEIEKDLAKLEEEKERLRDLEFMYDERLEGTMWEFLSYSEERRASFLKDIKKDAPEN
jgi:septal ring factor EnvC (AmiA/AmiB activator)